MEDSRENLRDLGLLEEIERDPDITQANMATRLGVAVGTVNWHLKRLIAKGYVKVKRAERKKLRYIITPEGLSLRARLTLAYIENSMQLYRRAREQARKALRTARKQGYSSVAVAGDCRHHSTGRIDAEDPMVQAVADPDVSRRVHRDALHRAQLHRRRSTGIGLTASGVGVNDVLHISAGGNRE